MERLRHWLMALVMVVVCLSPVLTSRPAEAASTYPISTVAGNGGGVTSGDGGPATSAGLPSPYGLASDSLGNLYVSDYWSRVRKIAPNGIITTVAGTSNGFGGDGGPATSAQLNRPSGLAVDSSDNLFISDRGNQRIRKVSTSGIITTVAGTGTASFSGDGGPAASAGFNEPSGISFDSNGRLAIADFGNGRVRLIDINGVVTTITGNGTSSYTGDGGPATSATVSGPRSVTYDASNNLLIADYDNHRVRRIGTNGIITSIAGNGTAGFNGDGISATSANLRNPIWTASDKAGNVYVAEYDGSRIRKVDTAGNISTIAGDGTTSFGGDGGDATAAKVSGPTGVLVDKNGTLYIADRNNNRIRSIIAVAAGGSVNSTTVFVEPSLTLGIAGEPATCNGVTPSVGSSSTGSAISLGRLSASSASSANQLVTFGSNGTNGMGVRLTTVSQLRSASGAEIAKMPATATNWPSAGNEAFGFRPQTAGGFGPDQWAADTTGATRWVFTLISPDTRSRCVSYRAQSSPSTPAGSYSATMRYTAVAYY